MKTIGTVHRFEWAEIDRWVGREKVEASFFEGELLGFVQTGAGAQAVVLCGRLLMEVPIGILVPVQDGEGNTRKYLVERAISK